MRTLEDRLETRKVVEKAKGRLMAEQGLSEAEAFRWIQRTAMNQRTSMKALAESILAAPPGPAGCATGGRRPSDSRLLRSPGPTVRTSVEASRLHHGRPR